MLPADYLISQLLVSGGGRRKFFILIDVLLLHPAVNIHLFQHIMAEPQFQYHFSNVFNPDISTNGGPTFLRHHGINGHLRILRALENNIDKVKLVLKGKCKHCRVDNIAKCQTSGVLTNVVCHRCDPMYRKCDFGFQRTVSMTIIVS